MTRLNLVSSTADRELDVIRQTVATFDPVSGLADVVAILRDRAACGEQFELLDAIGHSRTPGFLVLGTWEIDDSPQTAAAVSELLRPLLALLGVRTLRLLGCSTAATERASRALRRIAQASACNVLGTKRYISRHDYDEVGFGSDEALVDADGARPQIDPVGLASCAAPRLR